MGKQGLAAIFYRHIKLFWCLLLELWYRFTFYIANGIYLDSYMEMTNWIFLSDSFGFGTIISLN